jgi:hypothetical protein
MESYLRQVAPESFQPDPPTPPPTTASNFIIVLLGLTAIAAIVQAIVSGAPRIDWLTPGVACGCLALALLIRGRRELRWALEQHLYNLKVCSHTYFGATLGVPSALPDHAADFDQHFPDVAPVLRQTWELITPDVAAPKARVPSEELRVKWQQFAPRLAKIAKLDQLPNSCSQCRLARCLYGFVGWIPLPN